MARGSTPLAVLLFMMLAVEPTLASVASTEALVPVLGPLAPAAEVAAAVGGEAMVVLARRRHHGTVLAQTGTAVAEGEEEEEWPVHAYEEIRGWILGFTLMIAMAIFADTLFDLLSSRECKTMVDIPKDMYALTRHDKRLSPIEFKSSTPVLLQYADENATIKVKPYDSVTRAEPGTIAIMIHEVDDPMMEEGDADAISVNSLLVGINCHNIYENAPNPVYMQALEDLNGAIGSIADRGLTGMLIQRTTALSFLDHNGETDSTGWCPECDIVTQECYLTLNTLGAGDGTDEGRTGRDCGGGYTNDIPDAKTWLKVEAAKHNSMEDQPSVDTLRQRQNLRQVNTDGFGILWGFIMTAVLVALVVFGVYFPLSFSGNSSASKTYQETIKVFKTMLLVLEGENFPTSFGGFLFYMLYDIFIVIATIGIIFLVDKLLFKRSFWRTKDYRKKKLVKRAVLYWASFGEMLIIAMCLILPARQFWIGRTLNGKHADALARYELGTVWVTHFLTMLFFANTFIKLLKSKFKIRMEPITGDETDEVINALAGVIASFKDIAATMRDLHGNGEECYLEELSSQVRTLVDAGTFKDAKWDISCAEWGGGAQELLALTNATKLATPRKWKELTFDYDPIASEDNWAGTEDLEQCSLTCMEGSSFADLKIRNNPIYCKPSGLFGRTWTLKYTFAPGGEGHICPSQAPHLTNATASTASSATASAPAPTTAAGMAAATNP